MLKPELHKPTSPRKDCTCTFGPTDPEHGRKSGGVGINCRTPLRPIVMQPITDDFRDAMKTGRCMAYILDITGANVTIVNLYGWSGAHQNQIAAARTDDLLAFGRNELAVQPRGHQLICGDLNGETEDFSQPHEHAHRGRLDRHRRKSGHLGRTTMSADMPCFKQS